MLVPENCPWYNTPKQDLRCDGVLKTSTKLDASSMIKTTIAILQKFINKKRNHLLVNLCSKIADELTIFHQTELLNYKF